MGHAVLFSLSRGFVQLVALSEGSGRVLWLLVVRMFVGLCRLRGIGPRLARCGLTLPGASGMVDVSPYAHASEYGGLYEPVYRDPSTAGAAFGERFRCPCRRGCPWLVLGCAATGGRDGRGRGTGQCCRCNARCGRVAGCWPECRSGWRRGRCKGCGRSTELRGVSSSSSQGAAGQEVSCV